MLPLPRAENSSGPPWPLPGRDCLLSSMLNMQDLKGSVLSPPPKKKLQNKPLFRIGKSFKAARLGFVGPPASHGVNHTAGSGWRHSASSDKNVTTVEQRLKQQSCLEWMSVCLQKNFYSVRCGFADVIAKCLRASTVFSRHRVFVPCVSNGQTINVRHIILILFYIMFVYIVYRRCSQFLTNSLLNKNLSISKVVITLSLIFG